MTGFVVGVMLVAQAASAGSVEYGTTKPPVGLQIERDCTQLLPPATKDGWFQTVIVSQLPWNIARTRACTPTFQKGRSATIAPRYLIGVYR